MEFNLDNIMMLLFIILFIVSMSKIYAFLPSKVLADDDTTQKSKDKLLKILLKNIKKSEDVPSIDELFQMIIKDKDFDKKLFWRFNLNKLNHLLKAYYLQNENINSIEDIFNH